MTPTPPDAPLNARSLLLPYALALVASAVAIQLVIVVAGGDITAGTGVLTAFVAGGILVWLRLAWHRLRRIRFGPVVAHAVAFVAITTSFNVNAVISTVSIGAHEGSAAAAGHLLLTPWLGASLGMSAAWGVGLLLHLIGAILGRGWED